MARLYTVRRLKIGRTEQLDALARAAGELYSQVVVWFWRTVRHKDLWLRGCRQEGPGSAPHAGGECTR